MTIELVNHTDSNPTVNLNAELFQDIPAGLYVSSDQTVIICKGKVRKLYKYLRFR